MSILYFLRFSKEPAISLLDLYLVLEYFRYIDLSFMHILALIHSP